MRTFSPLVSIALALALLLAVACGLHFGSV